MATTLLNRLRAGDVAYAGAKRQAYGLVGPAKLVPYGEATVYAQTETPGGVGGTRAGDALLTLGAPASFGAVHAGRGAHVRGVDDRDASPRTAGDATLASPTRAA